MKNVTLRQLKIFEAVARNLSFSRAAEELHLTTWPLGRQTWSTATSRPTVQTSCGWRT